MTFPSILALLALAAAGGAAPAPATAEAGTDADLQRARAAAQAFSTRLRTALQARMQAEGPVGAIDFCHVQAPRIAAEVMEAQGVRLGRVAVPGRVRNPGNTPDGWLATTLATFQAAVANGAAAADQAMVQREGLPDDTALRLARGIAIEAPCLACHGSQIAPPVATALRRYYPDDRATGFAIGDLRGALWVEVPSTPSKESKP